MKKKNYNKIKLITVTSIFSSENLIGTAIQNVHVLQHPFKIKFIS